MSEEGGVHEDYPASLKSEQVQACLLHEQLCQRLLNTTLALS